MLDASSAVQLDVASISPMRHPPTPMPRSPCASATQSGMPRENRTQFRTRRFAHGALRPPRETHSCFSIARSRSVRQASSPGAYGARTGQIILRQLERSRNPLDPITNLHCGFIHPQHAAQPAHPCRTGPLSTASNSEPGTCLICSRSSSFQLGLGAPVMNHGEPLSATIRP
jgi:hypothetical protein